MNEDYILQRIKPFLNDQGMLGEEDFDRLFHMLSRREQYKVIDILIAHNIDIDYINRSVNRKAEENTRPGRIVPDKLTNEQLCIMFQQGNKQALEALIVKNENLVWSRVKKYKNVYKHKLDEDDLFQSGVIGIMIAAKKYDSSKDTRFTTYVIWWIDQQILRCIMDHGFTVRIPVHQFDSMNKIKRAFREHPECSKEQIIEIMKQNGISKDKFERLLTIIHNVLSISSLNTFVGEDEDSELGDFVLDDSCPSLEEQVELKSLKQIMKEVLDTIPPREQKILRLRYGIDDDRQKTLEEIGKEFDLTRERIRQIEEKALRKLRQPSRSKFFKDFII